MEIKGHIFLLVNLVASSAFFISTQEPDIVDIGEEVVISNNLLLDDILEPPFRPRSSVYVEDKLWTSPVPYVLDKDLDMNAKGVILRVFDQFRIKSCIDFKERDNEEYYLSIQKLEGCFSYVGRECLDGQNLSIGIGCDSFGIVEHEILHALGFHHEHSRYDRDDYVQIASDNILEGQEYNFVKIDSENSTTHGVPYDYLSVMHYGKNAFTNGNGSTILTIDPKYQDVIGQILEMSPSDVLELNLLYKCNSTIAFMFYCGFSNGTTCEMNLYSHSGTDWEVVTQVTGGPSSDHTSLPSGNREDDQELGYFMHASTASGQEGDSAKLETQVLSSRRECNVQCLQFYYYHSGNESDELNIWIREFEGEQNSTGTLQLMEQITGPPTSYWKLHHVSLNATKDFQVVFEVQKGAGSSTGGFSIDDINLSETECPHVTIQIDDFVNVLNTSASGTRLYSPRQYSKEGYAYRVAIVLYQTYVGMFVQLLSGVYDDQLEWPCLQRQITFQLLDQNPNMQLQMSKRWSFTTNQNDRTSNGCPLWNNTREMGKGVFYENATLVYGGYLWGFKHFMDLDELQSREFLKGESAIFMFTFEDLTPLVNGSTLPCPQGRLMNISQPLTYMFVPSNSTWNSSTISPPTAKADCNRISSSISPPPTTNRSSSTADPLPTTTDNNRSSSSISPPPTTTDNRSSSTVSPPTTTDDNRSFSPGMVASPVIILLALMLLAS